MSAKKSAKLGPSPGPAENRRPFLETSLVLSLLPLCFFAALLFARAPTPSVLVFDEVHYVPAAKALITFQDNLNFEHPPLAKFILGAVWWLFSDRLHLLHEPTVFRDVSVLFGLAALWAVRAWMLELGFSGYAAAAAMWLTGFNFLWFVQSKIAMLDIFYAAFGLWGTLLAWTPRTRARFWGGWALLGLAMACKWSAAPFVIAAVFFGGRRWPWRIAGVGVAIAAYTLTWVPLAFMAKNPVPLTALFDQTQSMISGMGTIAAADHPYRSTWWQWILMARPAWYHFEQSAAGDRNVWAAGNPVLCWATLPLIFLVVWAAFAHRWDRAAKAITALYWIPLLFWIVVPRRMQLYYYYLPSSMMLGPLAVWAHERFYRGRLLELLHLEFRHARGWLLFGFVLLCGATFVYFMPILDGRLSPSNEYQRFMWFLSWI